MKKLIGTLAVAALVASAAFADLGIGGFGRGIWAPVAYDGNDARTFEVMSWNGWSGAARAGIAFHGNFEDVLGFDVDFNADAGSPGNCDFARVWTQPWDWLWLSIGKTHDDTGRGNGCFGAFDWHRSVAGVTTIEGLTIGEDLTFTRFGNGGGGQAQGAILKITPIENLWIMAAFNVKEKTTTYKANPAYVAANDDGDLMVIDGKAVIVKRGYKDKTTGEVVSPYVMDPVTGKPVEETKGGIEDTYKTSQYGAGYIIEDIGHVRAQYIGQGDWGYINAAFDLNAIEDMYLTVGAYIPTDFDNNLKIAAYFRYNLGMPTIHALLNFVLNSGLQTLNAGVGLDLNFDSGIGVNLDVRVNYFDAPSKTQIGFLAGVKKNFSNGWLGAGFEGNVYDGTFQMAIPIAATYSF